MKNLANYISLTRIALVPVIIVLMMLDSSTEVMVTAFCIFVIAALSNFLDGYIARKTNTVSTIGKFLDLIADKILQTAVIIMLVANGTLIGNIEVTCVIVIILRELFISAFRQIASANNVVIAADIFGKVKTVSNFICLSALILATWQPFLIIGQIFLYITTALSIISAVNYVIKNKQVMKNL